MINRNPYQNQHSRQNSHLLENNPTCTQSRNSSAQKQQQPSVNNSQNYSFFQEQFMNNLPSPINKVHPDLSHYDSQDNILNYSSNQQIQSQINSRNTSRGQSPTNFQNKKTNFFAAKKLSVPEGMFLNQMGSKIEWDNKLTKQSSQDYSMGLRKLNGAKNSFSKQQIEQQTQYSSRITSNKPDKFFSQKLIQPSHNNMQEKYNNLSRSYQQLQKQYERMKQQNLKLRNSRQQLMNENIRTKKEASYQIENLSQEIQALKQQIYRLQMDHQPFEMTQRTLTNNNMSQNSTRGCYSRDLSFYRTRNNNPMNNMTQNGEVNLFYVQELQRQNDQLVRENRRLNDIVMKKLKHSIADN